MTPEEFDQAAHRLLQAEQHGNLEFPVPGPAAAGGASNARPASGGSGGRTRGASGGGGVGARGDIANRWDEDDFDDETRPLRSPTTRGAGGANPTAPSRSRRGGAGGGGGGHGGGRGGQPGAR